MLYRQTTPNYLLHWTYLGLLISASVQSSFSEWSGINFDTSGVTRQSEQGMAYDDGSDPRALNIIGMGTEQGEMEVTKIIGLFVSSGPAISIQRLSLT